MGQEGSANRPGARWHRRPAGGSFWVAPASRRWLSVRWPPAGAAPLAGGLSTGETKHGRADPRDFRPAHRAAGRSRKDQRARAAAVRGLADRPRRHGLFPNGSTGEFLRFLPAERREITRIVCQQAAGRASVVAQAAEANVRETLDACAAYGELGARAVAVVAPYYYRPSAESIYAYFREIARNSSIDVTLYHIPAFASPLDVPTVRRLAELPRIVGIKDSSGDLAFFMRLIAAVRTERPDFAFLTGSETILAPAISVGADGGVHAISGVISELTRKLYDLACSGRRRGDAAPVPRARAARRAGPPADFPQGLGERSSCGASAWAAAASRKPNRSRSIARAWSG